MNRITIENAGNISPLRRQERVAAYTSTGDPHKGACTRVIAQPSQHGEDRNPVANTTPLSVSQPSREHYDVIIVGSGMGGGTLAFALKDAGITVLLIERGGFVPQEAQNWDAEAVFAQGRYKNAEDWYDTEGRPFSPGTYYYVGGNTKFYGSSLVRFRREDFQVHHPPRRASPPPGRSGTTTSPRTTAAPKRSTRCTATSMTRRCRAVNPSRSAASVTNHRCKRWPTGCASWATPRRRSRSASTCARADPAFVAPPATASPAERWPNRMPTCPAYVPPSPAAPSNSSPTPVSIGYSPTPPADAPPVSNV